MNEEKNKYMPKYEEMRRSTELRNKVFDALAVYSFAPKNKRQRMINITLIVYVIGLFLILNNAAWFISGVVVVFVLSFPLMVSHKIGYYNKKSLYDLTKVQKMTVSKARTIDQTEADLSLKYKYECLRTATGLMRYMILWVSWIGSCLYLHFHPMPFFIQGFV